MGDFLGVALLLAATFAAALGYALQKKANVSLAAQAPSARRSLWTSPLWLGGLGSLIASSLLVVASAPFLDQSKTAPLGAATLVFSTILSTLILREKFLVLHLMSVSIIIAGSVTAASANSNPSKTLSFDEIVSLFDGVAIGYTSVMVALASCAAVWLWRAGAAGPARWSASTRGVFPLLAPALGGFFNGWVSYAVKAQTTALVAGDWQALQGGVFWAFTLLVVVAVTGQVYYLNAGLAFFSAMRIVPVFQCIVILANAVAGIVYFGDMRANPSQLGIFFLGAAVCGGGILLLLLNKEGGDAAAAAGVVATDSAPLLTDGGGAEAASPTADSSSATATTPLSSQSSTAAPGGATDSGLFARRETNDGTAAEAQASAALDEAKRSTPWYLVEVIALVREWGASAGCAGLICCCRGKSAAATRVAWKSSREIEQGALSPRATETGA